VFFENTTWRLELSRNSLRNMRVLTLSRQSVNSFAHRFCATEEACLMKRIYKLTVIEEREEVPLKPPSIFMESWGLMVRVGLAIAAIFHWGH
jgi:hypothetical protein